MMIDIGYKLYKSEYTEDKYIEMINAVNLHTDWTLKETDEYWEVVEYTPDEEAVKFMRVRKLKKYLAETDYITAKLTEAQIVHPEKLQELIEKYSPVIRKREEAREELDRYLN